MTNKVYVVAVDFTVGGLQNAVMNTLALRQDIFELANAGTEQIYFHRYKDDMLGGAPNLLLECSEEFLEKVKTLPRYGNSLDLWTGFDTFRAGHAGPVDAAQLKRVTAKETTDPDLDVATWRLQDDIIRLGQNHALEGKVLVRQVDGLKGFVSVICPDDFAEKILSLPRCAKISATVNKPRKNGPKP